MPPLNEADLPVYLEVGQPASQERSLADIWSALGGELKPSLDLVVTAPIVVDSSAYIGPPIQEGPSIGISSTGGASERAQRAGRRRGTGDRARHLDDRAAAGQRGRQGRRRAHPRERRPSSASPVSRRRHG